VAATTAVLTILAVLAILAMFSAGALVVARGASRTGRGAGMVAVLTMVGVLTVIGVLTVVLTACGRRRCVGPGGRGRRRWAVLA